MNLTFIRIVIIGALAIALVFALSGFRGGQVENVTAEEKPESIHIIPALITSRDWENVESAQMQDLSDDAIFNDFSTGNSAYVVSEEYSNTHSLIASASLPGLTPEVLPGIPHVTPQSELIPATSPELSPVIPEGGEAEIDLTPQPQSETNLPATEVQTPEPTPDAVTPSGEASVPSAFYRLLEGLIFRSALAQESSIGSNSYDKFLSCDEENAECVSKNIEFGGFGIADTLVGKPIKNIQLRFSLAGARADIADTQVPGRVVVEYFYKDRWSRAGEILITDEVSNSLNGGYFLYALPEIKSWEELDDLRVRLSVQYFGSSDMNIFLDGLWLEADADFDDAKVIAQDPVIEEDQSPESDLELISASDSFTSYEIPEFSFDYKRDSGIMDLVSSFFMSLVGRGGVDISVIDQKTNLRPRINTDGDSVKVEFENSRSFVPGRHRLKIDISDNGNEYRQEQEFLWGTLFINMEKISYRPGETARIYIEALDDLGNPVCNTDIWVEVKSSLGRISTFSTENGNIYYSGKCLAGGDKKMAGFYLNYHIPPEIGSYTIELSAQTISGPRSLSDNFEVVDFYPVEIIRDAPVNIMPGIEYGVSFSITSDSDFEGVFKEVVPANFEIIPSLVQDSPAFSIDEDGFTRIISWPVSLKSGESRVVSYSFRALNSSTALYVVGPASLGSFQEPKLWQIVSPGGDRSLMINNNSAHSCKMDPFSREVSAGGNVRYDINLISSEPDKPFLLTFPDLPPEVTVSLNRAIGSVAGVYADIFVQPDAPRASSNLIMVYQERESNGAILGTYCQFNLVVE